MSSEQVPQVIEGYWIDKAANRHRYIFDDRDLEVVTEEKPGFPKALRRLKNQALNWVNLPWSNLDILASEKKRPYPKTPLDLMLLVVKDEEDEDQPDSISSHGLTTQELGNILIYAKKMLGELTTVADRFEKKVVKKTLSINFHQNPLPSENIGDEIKTYAQTLNPLHAHAFVLTEDDLKLHKDQELPKPERDIVRDPMSFVMEAILVIPSIRDKFSLAYCEQLSPGRLEFKTREKINEFELAGNLQALHDRYLTLYYELMSLFVDPNQEDMIGMPLLELEQMYANINVFIQELKKRPANRDSVEAIHNIDRLSKIFHKLAGLLKEIGQEQVKNGERLFLRTAAYTLLLEPDDEPGHWQITLDPRLISTGNALNSYGYTKKIDEKDKPPREWWEMHREMTRKVRRIRMNNGRNNFNE